MSVAVVVDSASDLPNELADALGIRRVPLTISLDGVDYKDGTELSRERFWELAQRASDLPKTAAPSPGEFDAAFSSELDAGANHVICLTMTKDLSATYQAALAAASAYSGRVSVFDTRSLTVGEGLVAVSAATAAQAGADTEECQRIVSATIERVVTFGMLDTLENLRRGGRIGAAQALLGSVLSIKPVIEVRDGAVEPESKQRTRGRSLHYLADRVIAAGPLRRLAVTHAAAKDLDDFLALIDGVECESAPVVSYMGPVIGAHVGRGAIGVAFWPCTPERPANVER